MNGGDAVRSFRVPDLGEGLEEVTVTCWNVAVGDDVELNQILCSVETAKAEVEIPSPYAGRIVERLWRRRRCPQSGWGAGPDRHRTGRNAQW